MWKRFFSFDYFPWQNFPAVWFTSLVLSRQSKWSYGVPVAKLQIFHPPKDFLHGYIPHVTLLLRRTTFSVELIFAPAEDVKTGFVLLKWIGPLSSTAKFLVAWKPPDIFETLALIFSLKEPKSFSLYILWSPKIIIALQDERLKFWGWLQNPNIVIEKSMCLSLCEFLVTPLDRFMFLLKKVENQFAWFLMNNLAGIKNTIQNGITKRKLATTNINPVKKKKYSKSWKFTLTDNK